MEALVAQPPHAAGGIARDSARFAFDEEAVAPGEVQRGAAAGLHRRHLNGPRIAVDRSGDLQADAVGVADDAVRRLHLGARPALCLDDWLCTVFPDSHSA